MHSSEIKWQNMVWKTIRENKKTSKLVHSTRTKSKVFWDAQSVYLPSGVTINAERYCLSGKTIKQKQPGLLTTKFFCSLTMHIIHHSSWDTDFVGVLSMEDYWPSTIFTQFGVVTSIYSPISKTTLEYNVSILDIMLKNKFTYFLIRV